MEESDPRALSRRLLAWYDRHRRVLPWRVPPGGRPDPYRVWLSEVMLQQTTVATVGPYFEDFIARWPNVEALATASRDQVMHAWQGLGYYARARNMHDCARILSRDYAGVFPEDEPALRALPGIGAYTSAAIAAIAFAHPATVVDGNIERVMARLHGIDVPLGQAKARLKALAEALTPRRRPGDYAQAVMDLGATICTPRRPACGRCPWARSCIGRATGRAEVLPVKALKKKKPVRHGITYWTVRPDRTVLLRKRPETGLLGGMMEVPSTAWREAAWSDRAARAEAPVKGARWRSLPGTVRHSFTHFHLEIMVRSALVSNAEAAASGIWCPIDQFGDHALPTVMKKVIRHALECERDGVA